MNEKASEEILKVEQKYNLLRRPFLRSGTRSLAGYQSFGSPPSSTTHRSPQSLRKTRRTLC